MRRRPRRSPMLALETLESRQLLTTGTIGVSVTKALVAEPVPSPVATASSFLITPSPNGTGVAFHYAMSGTAVNLNDYELYINGAGPATTSGDLLSASTVVIDVRVKNSLTVDSTRKDLTLTISNAYDCQHPADTWTTAPNHDTITLEPPAKPNDPSTCPLPQRPKAAALGSPGTSGRSPAGVGYPDGSIVAAPALDGLMSGGYGLPWGFAPSWTNSPGYEAAAGGSPFGRGMVNAGVPSLRAAPGNGYMAVNGAGDATWFDTQTGGGYKAKFFNQDTLTADAGTGDFIQADTLGDVIRYYGFQSTVPAAQQGKLRTFTTPDGKAVTANYDGSGRVTSTTRGDGITDEATVYTYLTSGPNAGKVSNVALRRGPAGGAPGSLPIVRQVDYAYYDGTQLYGNVGDLQTATVKDLNGQILDTTYYRYYTENDASPNGYVHGLKYMFGPQAYARLLAGLTSTVPANSGDSLVSGYADAYYEYDAGQRVKTAILQGQGCSCANGLGIYRYEYTTSANTPNGNYNIWTTQTVETLPDSSKNTVYSNLAGEVMLSEFKVYDDPVNPTLNTQRWLTYNRYDTDGRLVLMASPSAVLNYSAANADLVAYPSTLNLAAASGRIDVIDYGQNTTATASAAGDVIGYVKGHSVKQGTGGTAIALDATAYFSHADSATVPNTIYPVASSTVYSNVNGTGAQTTTFAYTWTTGTNHVATSTATLPVVSSAQNGPGGTGDATTTAYDPYGRPVQVTDPDSKVRTYFYDNATGALTKMVEDDVTGGLKLTTNYQVDGLGRTTLISDPLGHLTYVVYKDPTHEVRTYRGWDPLTGTATGPTEVWREDRPGSFADSLTMTATPATSGSAGTFAPTGAEGISGVATLSRGYTDTAGRVIEADRYFSLSGVTYSSAKPLGVVGTNYYATIYGYDRNGNLGEVRDALGTYTETLYDALGRVTAVYVGTDASKTDTKAWTPAVPGNPSYPGNATTASAANMVKVAAYEYDGNGVGDGNLTKSTQFPDAVATNARVTAYAYDWRDRLVATKSGVQGSEALGVNRPIVFYDMDNLGRVTAVSQYDGDGVALSIATPPVPGLLRSYSTTDYDDQGRPYQLRQFSVDPSTGTKSTNALTTNLYYDRRGNLIASSAPGGLVTKTAYDAAGRPVKQSWTDGAGGASWSAAGGTAGDHVLAEALTTYDAAGNVILTTTKERFHDASGAAGVDTGPLGTATTSPKARVSYRAAYYDKADRPIGTADVGTNGGTAYSPPTPNSPPPVRGDTTLVTTIAYNSSGWVDTTTDPRNVATRTPIYDMLGRPVQVIAGYDAAVNSGQPTASNNAQTQYAYDALDHVIQSATILPSGSPYAYQATAYIYGVTIASGSKINSNSILSQIRQPNQGTGLASISASDWQTFTYNALGDATTTIDPNGTTHAYDYDALGRRFSDAVTLPVGSPVNGNVKRLETAYDGAGRAYLFTSYDNTAGGGIVNQVQDVFNGLGQLTAEYQDHSTTGVTASSPKVQYAYSFNPASGGANHSRITGMTYPNGRVVNYTYNAGVDAAISRLSALTDGATGATLEADSYLGLGTLVRRVLPGGVALSYINQPSDPQAGTDAGDQYGGLDRFGRVVGQFWLTGEGTTTRTPLDRLFYGYDRDGQRTYTRNDINAASSELYHADSTVAGDAQKGYDALGRLVTFQRGELAITGFNPGQYDSIKHVGGAVASRAQTWSLDALGNWSTLATATATSSTTTSTTTAARTFNAQNEIASLPGGVVPAYDNAGNLTTYGGQNLIYDAWNRLIAATDGTNLLVAYAYDALGRRVVENYVTAGVKKDLYVSGSGNMLEQQNTVLGATSVKYQEVWSPTGVNVLAVRDEYASGSISQRLAVLQDPQGNVTALASTAGTVLERYLYDPYGSVTVVNPSTWAPASGQYGWQDFFQGGRRDPVTGDVHFGARDYVPAEGRWLQRDPLGLGAGDANIYRFVGSNPVNLIDPSGLTWLYRHTVYGYAYDLWFGVQEGVNEDVQSKADALSLMANTQAQSDLTHAAGPRLMDPDRIFAPPTVEDLMGQAPTYGPRMGYPGGQPDSDRITGGLKGATTGLIEAEAEIFGGGLVSQGKRAKMGPAGGSGRGGTGGGGNKGGGGGGTGGGGNKGGGGGGSARGGSGGKGGDCPTPRPKAPNGKLPRYEGPKPRYSINPAHVPGTLRKGKTPLPADAEAVFGRAVPDDAVNPKNWFGRNANGQIYRFSGGNDGTAHFSGIDGVGDGIRNLTKYASQRLQEMSQ